MADCFKKCFSCLKLFKASRVANNELTEFNNSCIYKNSCSNLSDSKLEQPPENKVKTVVSPLKSTIITGRNMKSTRLNSNLYLSSENSEDLSSISKKSFIISQTSLKIPSPVNKKSSKVIPIIFSPRPEGKLPKLFLAVPRKKYPRSKSYQIQKIEKNFNLEEPKFKE